MSDDAKLAAAWRARHETPAYEPGVLRYQVGVKEDVDEPWAACLLDLAPRRTMLPAPVRRQQTRAGRRTLRQAIRARLPRLELRGVR